LLTIEAVVEGIDVKQALFARLEVSLHVGAGGRRSRLVVRTSSRCC
jgi:hypothetical protein